MEPYRMSSSTAQPNSSPRRIPIRDGLLTAPLSDLKQVRLQGSRCTSCNETTLGRNSVCPNCGRDELIALPLSPRGELWTYTVVRHRPPGDYRGPDPFAPFGLGLVELPEGLRVLAPIEADIAQLEIGMPVEFRTRVRVDPDGREVVTFAFAPVARGDALV
jgi:uncharacterized OB-fold protein